VGQKSETPTTREVDERVHVYRTFRPWEISSTNENLHEVKQFFILIAWLSTIAFKVNQGIVEIQETHREQDSHP
jgi:hypothetical protein